MGCDLRETSFEKFPLQTFLEHGSAMFQKANLLLRQCRSFAMGKDSKFAPLRTCTQFLGFYVDLAAPCG